MTSDRLKSKRLVGLFLLGLILFNYPILSLFNLNIIVFGIPLLCLYLFTVWAGLILLIVLITKFDWLSPPPESPPRGP